MLLDFQYIKCPKCGKWYAHDELMSYSVFGNSECWSDGKCVTLSMPEYSFLPFSKCESCHELFWFEDCEKFHEYELKEYFEANPIERQEMKLIADFISKNPDYQSDNNNLSLNYPYAHYWDNLPEYLIKDFILLLEQTDSLSEEKEIYARTKLWQRINDLVRNYPHPLRYHFKGGSRFLLRFNNTIEYHKTRKKNKKLYKGYEKLKTENLQRLIQLLEVKELFEDELFLIIEACRELGNFEKAKATLKELEKISNPGNKRFVGKTKIKLLLKSRRFFKL